MSDENDPDTTDDTVDKIEDKLDNKNLTHDDLEALRSELTSHINSLRSDRTKDAEEKAADRAKMEILDEKLTKLLDAQEAKDKVTTDESTIIVPPDHLDPPTHQNSDATVDTDQENQTTSEVKKRKKGWKAAW